MTESRRIVVTGATGMIGRNLCKRLHAAGYSLTIFSRDPVRARTLLPNAADYVAWSPTEHGEWANAINTAWGVIHLAGAPISGGLLGARWTDANKARILSSRVLGTRGIVNAMRAAQTKPQVLVCASAVGYYGYSDARELSEESPAGSDFVAQICVDWEREALRADDAGIRTTMIRTGIVLDPETGALPQIMLPFRLFTGGPIMPSDQWYSWIHPADEVELIMLALEDSRVQGPLNAVAPNPLTNRDFAHVVGKVINSPAWLPVPATAIRLLLGEMADLVIKGQRVLPKKALALGYHFRFAMLEPALRDLLGVAGTASYSS